MNWRLFCILLPLALAAKPVFAWGVAGHVIVADIAERHMTAQAVEQMHRLLRDEGWEHLDQVATWADEIRPYRKDATPWHFVDIPLGDDHYDAAKDCPKGDCVIEAINRFRAILADRGQSTEARREALKFLVHFVGDIHQPLHGADNDDHGGNKVQVNYFGNVGDEKWPLSLHWVWDTSVIERVTGLPEGKPGDANIQVRQNATMLAAKLDARITPAETAAAKIQDPVVWAMESHELARKVVYPGLVAPGAPVPAERIVLGEDYQKKAWPVIEDRLKLGGLRLAILLNQALQ